MIDNSTNISFGSGSAINDNMLYVASFIDSLPDIDHTRMFVLNLNLPEKWFYHDIESKTVTSTAVRQQQGALARAGCALTADGTIEIYNTEGTEVLTIPRSTDAPLTSIAVIDNVFFICGSEAQMYRLEWDHWEEAELHIAGSAAKTSTEMTSIVDSDASEKFEALIDTPRSLTTLQCIDGLSKYDVYTCGTHGKIYHWNGSSWNQCESGTRQHLHNTHCVAPDDILVCGHNGTVVRGNYTDGFKPISSKHTDINLWSIRLFMADIYVGTVNGLFTLRDGTLNKVLLPDIPLPPDYIVESLSSTVETLWVVADTFVLRLSQGNWELIEHPDNM